MELSEFRSGRFFYQSFLNGGRAGWFFSAREGNFGPFATKLQAQFELELFIQSCMEKRLTGGRNRDVAQVGAEEVVAAPSPSEEVHVAESAKNPLPANSYFDRLRSVVRERAAKYMPNS